MTSASTVTTVLFVALVALMAALVAWALSRAVGRPPWSGAVAVVLFLTVYLAVPGVLAAVGWLDRYDPPPPAPILLVLGLTAVTATVAFSRAGARLHATLGLALLVGYQVFRVPVELLLHRLFVDGVIPIEMTYSGRNFDIVTGITGGLLGVWVARRTVPRGVVLAWNILGLALLVNIVTVAILSTPVSFRHFVDGPPNLLPSTFPFVWLPSFLVQFALVGHLLVFRALRRG